MAVPLMIRGSAYEDGGCSIMARVTGANGSNISQASVDSIACAVFDSSGTAAGTPAVVVNDSVFDSLQTDSRWTKDDTGYNFRHDVPATVMATGDDTYRFEYLFTPAVGEVFWVIATVHANAILTS